MNHELKATTELAKKQLLKQLVLRKEKPVSNREFPFVTQGGKWLWADKWSNGFFIGQLWRMYQLDRDELWREEAEKHIWALESYKTQGDFQDIGYLFTYSFVLGYKVTRNAAFRRIALEAANHLFQSQMGGGHLKCNWLDQGEHYSGIDAMMNIQLWLWAYEETNEMKFKEAALRCVNHAIRTMIWPNGGTYEYVRVEPDSGKFLEAANKNSARADSVWARGHVWATYGLIQAFVVLRSPFLIPVIDRLTDFYLRHAGTDLVPRWDLLIDDPVAIVDSSAAGAMASAWVQYACASGRKEYADSAASLLTALNSSKYRAKEDLGHEGVLLHASTPLRIVSTSGESQSWGDYFLLEANYYYMRRLEDEHNRRIDRIQ